MNETVRAIHTRLSSFWEQKHWNFQEGITLLAISGGKDSMLLAQIFLAHQFPIAVAHANFQLRGADSEKDQEFVKNWCEKNDVPFYSKRFNLEDENSNIQIAARAARYQWFDELMKENKFNYLAIAHHHQDSVETFLINFGRGTGIRGLLGIPQQRDQIIRPLACLLPNELEFLMQQYQLVWREDKSNAENKYLRNKIRQEVLPSLEKSISNFYQNSQKTITQLNQDYQLLNELINNYMQQLISRESGLVKIDLLKIETHPHRVNLLFHMLRSWEFNGSQVDQIWDSYHRQDGGIFISPSTFATLRNNVLILDENQLTEEFFIQINKNQNIIHLPLGTLTFAWIDKPKSFPKSKSHAFLDASKITWPLIIRSWQPGDTFQPLGMKGKHQKLQDFYTNNKYSIVEKKRSLLLLSDQKIAWVINERISQAFALDEDSIQCLHIFWQSN